jgi:hypothetical protein
MVMCFEGHRLAGERAQPAEPDLLKKKQQHGRQVDWVNHQRPGSFAFKAAGLLGARANQRRASACRA